MNEIEEWTRAQARVIEPGRQVTARRHHDVAALVAEWSAATRTSTWPAPW